MNYEVTLYRTVEHRTTYLVKDVESPEEAEDLVFSGDYYEIIDDEILSDSIDDTETTKV